MENETGEGGAGAEGAEKWQKEVLPSLNATVQKMSSTHTFYFRGLPDRLQNKNYSMSLVATLIVCTQSHILCH